MFSSVLQKVFKILAGGSRMVGGWLASGWWVVRGWLVGGLRVVEG